MPETRARDLMVPKSQCAMVSHNATRRDAVTTMEATRLMYQRWDYRPRIVLAHDEDYQVVGVVRHYEILKALEPKYGLLGDIKALSCSGMSREESDSVFKNYSLWTDPLADLCRKASVMKVREIMAVITENEWMPAEVPLVSAIHRMLLGNYPSLCLTGEGGFVGILRMSDVAGKIVNELKKCGTVYEGRSD